jgi:hypothetical protein
VRHGIYSMPLQNEDGQMPEAHSVLAGLDYPGMGPELEVGSMCRGPCYGRCNSTTDPFVESPPSSTAKRFPPSPFTTFSGLRSGPRLKFHSSE